MIPEWMREQVLDESQAALRRIVNAAFGTPRKPAEFSQVILVELGGDSEYPDEVATLLQRLRDGAARRLQDAESVTPRDTAFQVRRIAPAHRVTIGGFWRDRCCRDVARELGAKSRPGSAPAAPTPRGGFDRKRYLLSVGAALPPSLWHGTSLLNLVSILAMDELTGTEAYGTDDGPNGVSLTTHEASAQAFAERANQIWAEVHGDTAGDDVPRGGAVLEFVTERVTRDFKTQRFNTKSTLYAHEREVRVLTPDGAMNRAAQYVRSIRVSGAEIEWFKSFLGNHPDAGWGVTPAQLERLRLSPLVTLTP